MAKQKRTALFETYTGEVLDLLNPSSSVIHVKDIAHALSNICRFAGHCDRFYSVAEHSVLAYRRALYMGASPRMAALCLLHDTEEAYVGDVTNPLKSCLPALRRIVKPLRKSIHLVFGMCEPNPSECRTIKQIDEEMLAEEINLMPFGWIAPSLHKKITGIRIRCWSPRKAERKFLAAIGEAFPNLTE